MSREKGLPVPTLDYYISEVDGARVIHVDTPEEWPDSELETLRIYINDDVDDPIYGEKLDTNQE